MLKPLSVIKADLGIPPNGPVQKFFTDTCAKHMDKYIPRDTGMLRDNITKTTNSITYESPYAHAQYVGIVHGSPVKNYTTPGTGPYWDKRMWSAEKNIVIKEVQDYVDRG
jgi:hypothetical protein